MLDILSHSGAPAAAVAVRDAESDEEWSYGRLRAEVDACAAKLEEDKSMVLLLVGRDPWSLVNYLGSLKAGHAVLPIESGLDPALLTALVASYSPELVLGTPRTMKSAAADLPDYKEMAAPNDQAALLRRRDGATSPIHPDVSLLLSTSGSTGSPKLVRLTPRNVLSNADAIRSALSIDASQRPITTLPWSYSFGLSVVHSHLLAGGTIVITERNLVSKDFWNQARGSQASTLYGVPYMYEFLRRLDFDRIDLPSLRVLAQAGGKLANPLIQHFAEAMRRRGGRFFVMYGQTEATARISVLPWDALPEKLGSVGLPLPGGSLSTRSLDETGTGSAGQEGEIVYSGPNVMMGYSMHRTDLARGDELGGVLYTGDLGFIDGGGYLYVSGRLKRIAKVFGLRVSLDEVESSLHESGPVVALDCDDRICLCCTDGVAAGVAAAIDGLARRLRIPPSGFSIRTVPSIPHLPNGKVDYSGLRALL